jgi:thiamine kinase-like enzyme
MIHTHLPTDPRIVDEIFSLTATPGLEEVGWLLGMVATYGKSPVELEGFIWKDDTIEIKSKKRPVRPLHPQWVFLFQLKEKQPVRKNWKKILKTLDKQRKLGRIHVDVLSLLLAYKVRKIYYTPIKQQQKELCLTAF